MAYSHREIYPAAAIFVIPIILNDRSPPKIPRSIVERNAVSVIYCRARKATVNEQIDKLSTFPGSPVDFDDPIYFAMPGRPW